MEQARLWRNRRDEHDECVAESDRLKRTLTNVPQTQDQFWACTTTGPEGVPKTTLTRKDMKWIGKCWQCVLNYHRRVNKRTNSVFEPCGNKNSTMDHDNIAGYKPEEVDEMEEHMNDIMERPRKTKGGPKGEKHKKGGDGPQKEEGEDWETRQAEPET